MDKCYKFEAAKEAAKTPSPHAKAKELKKPGGHRAPTSLHAKPTAFFSYRPDDEDDPPSCTKLSYQACTYDSRSELKDNQLFSTPAPMRAL
jgi:hypothetical protein